MLSDDIARKFLGICAITFIVVGTPTNVLTCIVCLRQSLRTTPTFVFIAFIAFCDIFSLYGLNLDWYFYNAWFSPVYLSDYSDLYCHIHYFIHLFPLKTAAWLLVFMSVEAYLSVRFSKWRKAIFNSKKAAILSLSMFCVFFAADFYLNFSAEIKESQVTANNATTSSRAVCTTDSHIFNIYLTIQTYVYSLIPFTLLVVFNTLLIHRTYTKKLKASSLTNHQKTSLKSMTMTIFIDTLLFIVCSSPVSISGGYFLDTLRSSSNGLAWLAFFNVLRFLRHSLNFITLCLVNRKFKQEVLKMMRKDRIGIETSMTRTA